MSSRLAEKLKKLGLAPEGAPAPASTPAKTKDATKKKPHLTFRIYFPLPPFDPSVRFRALKAAHGTFNFTGALLGPGGVILQSVKQQSNARVELVNAQGNLHGLHPDPLDEHLHALISADSMAKLQLAADLVVEVLSPTNASYEPFRVEPGGSTRLTVLQPIKSKPGNTGARSKAAKQAHLPNSSSNSSSRPRPSLDGSTKGMPPSPALTPVTPAATGSRQGSMFAGAGSSAPSSCCSSRAPTPSIPHGSSVGATAHLVSDGSGEGGSAGVHSRLEGFQLPPAALPAQPQLPFALEQWPALPSSQDSCSSSQDSGAAAARPKEAPGIGAGQALSSTSCSKASGSSASWDRRQASADRGDLQKPDSIVSESSQDGSRHTGVQHDSQAYGSLQHTHAPSAAAAAAESEQPAAQAGPGRGKGATMAAWAGSSADGYAYTELAPASITVHSTDAGAEQGMLPPLTPHQYQGQQPRQQEPYFSHHQQQQQRQPQQGGAELGLCPAGCGETGGGAFRFGVSWDGGSVGRSSLDGSVVAGCGAPYGMMLPAGHGPSSQLVQPGGLVQPALSRGLDLDALRTRSALVANACLHGPDAPAIRAPGCCVAGSGGYALGGDGCLQAMMARFAGGGVMEAGSAAGCCLGGQQQQHHHHHHQGQQREAEYQQQQHMRMMAAEAAAYGGGVGGMMPFQPGGSLPAPSACAFAQFAQTAAVAAAASSVFGGGGGASASLSFGGGGDGACGSLGAGACGSLGAGGFLAASKSIW